MIIRYVLWLFVSLGVKLFLVKTMFSYSNQSLPVYSMSELIVMTLFAVFKSDEDCFSCFQRADCETYSIFQVKQSLLRDELFESTVTVETNNEKLIQKQLGRDSNISQERSSSIQNRELQDSLRESTKSFDSDYYMKQQLEIEQREAKRTIIEN